MIINKLIKPKVIAYNCNFKKLFHSKLPPLPTSLLEKILSSPCKVCSITKRVYPSALMLRFVIKPNIQFTPQTVHFDPSLNFNLKGKGFYLCTTNSLIPLLNKKDLLHYSIRISYIPPDIANIIYFSIMETIVNNLKKLKDLNLLKVKSLNFGEELTVNEVGELAYSLEFNPTKSYSKLESKFNLINNSDIIKFNIEQLIKNSELEGLLGDDMLNYGKDKIIVLNVLNSSEFDGLIQETLLQILKLCWYLE
ncbi:hypothetical protein CONCODRAFT_14555 [Conidiobolus coronatus NRRL 28638]|uniref:YlxR domain-containing protein n=1 Tax=Conidiobolus coronatus (strain ATCC 28846 / CBS 209.66 / NRRL 28638) TaxID=796925 RepID=A0A137PII5_CONC2|nr:hypothetical protein CONCODRAFT_14555 [Conidiobolus coronatus NRRL 28638]|eukprot:KXN74799.1 hypothetical protein CONCODRAFT_14555 [Conidiobolus coronatus NRRL 28638]